MKVYRIVGLALTLLTLAPQGSFAGTKHVAATKRIPANTEEAVDPDANAGSSAPDKVNCHVTVITVRKSGESTERHFYSFTPDKDGCSRDAELHRINFAPHAVLEKKVSFEWRGR